MSHLARARARSRTLKLAAIAVGASTIAACVPEPETPPVTTSTTTSTTTTIPAAPGAIRITEWMYDGPNGEFVELTNVGGSPVDLAGWSYDDDSRTPGVFDLSGLGTVRAGESVLFVESSPTAFRSAWGLCEGVKVVGPYTNNLGRADEINIFDGGGELVDRLTYGDNAAPGGPRTQNRSGRVSAAGLGANVAAQWSLSSVGDVESSWTSVSNEIASPGRSAHATVALDVCDDPGSAAPITLSQSVLTAAIGDPTNPTVDLDLGDSFVDPDVVELSFASSNATVVPAANIAASTSGATRTIALTPTGRGLSTITITASDTHGTTATATLSYAASGDSGSPSGRYHVGVSDASASLDVGDGYMVSVNDETNTLFLHRTEYSGAPLKTWTFTAAQLGTSSEVDFEGISRSGSTVVITGSHGNNRSGEVRTERRALIAATISGSGANTELTYSGRYNGLWDDLRTWDSNNGHGLGANALGFVAATAPGVQPNPPAGFNIEALEHAPDGTTLYLGFRAPTVNVAGVERAVVVPVTNSTALLSASPGTGPAAFGDPILMDLGGRSVRSIARNASNDYLIIAGPSAANDSWALYSWNGTAADQPQLRASLPNDDGLTRGAWEAIASVPESIAPGEVVRIVADSGDTNYYGTGAAKDLDPALQKSFSMTVVLG